MEDLDVKEKPGIVFYKDWSELLEKMPNDMKLALLNALNRYHLYREMPPMNDPCYWVFFGWSKQIERDLKKYDKRVEINRENGKKGGRPKKNQKNPVGFSETQQNPTKAKKANNNNNKKNNNKNNNKNKNKNKDKDKDKKEIDNNSLSLDFIFADIDKNIIDKENNAWYKGLYDKYTPMWDMFCNHYSFSIYEFRELRKEINNNAGKDDSHDYGTNVIKEKLCAISNNSSYNDKRFNSIILKVKEYISNDYNEKK